MAETGDFLDGLILVVDDEPIILRLTSSVLGGAGFRVVVAEDGAAGLAAWNRRRSEITLVLADVMMPVMGGLEMARRMIEIDPRVKLLFMSGYSDVAEEVAVRQRFPFIRKPFLPEDLIRKVQQMVDSTALS